MKIKDFMRAKGVQVGTALMLAAPAISCAAFAADEGTEGSSAVVTAINSAVTSVKGDAVTVIGAAVGLGVVFWGAKVLWSKFKGMKHSAFLIRETGTVRASYIRR